MLREKIGEIQSLPEAMEDDTREEPEEQDSTECENQQEHPSTEEDLLGVTQVAYIHPDAEPEEDPECITLPPEAEHSNKQACTLSTVQLKKEVQETEPAEQETESIFLMDDAEEPTPEPNNVMVEPNFDAIADAVKATLSTQPGLNLTGEVQMKVKQEPGKPTQVEVTTEDGSVIIMELMTEEDSELPEIPEQEVSR